MTLIPIARYQYFQFVIFNMFSLYVGCDSNGGGGSTNACPRSCPGGTYSTGGLGYCGNINAGVDQCSCISSGNAISILIANVYCNCTQDAIATGIPALQMLALACASLGHTPQAAGDTAKVLLQVTLVLAYFKW